MTKESNTLRVSKIYKKREFPLAKVLFKKELEKIVVLREEYFYALKILERVTDIEKFPISTKIINMKATRQFRKKKRIQEDIKEEVATPVRTAIKEFLNKG